MKQFNVISIVALIIVCLFLTLSATPRTSAKRNQQSSLDQEALQQSRQFFGGMSKKCGDYYYYKYNQSKSYLYQCKYAPNVSVEGKTLQPRQLSEADRLNGVDPLPVAWQGRAVIHLGVCRMQSYAPQSFPGYNAWESWTQVNDDALPLINRKGQWEFYNKPTGREAYTVKVITPITCDEIPSETRRFAEKLPYWKGEAKNGAGYPIGNVLRIPATFGKWFSLGRGPITFRLPSVFSRINVDGTDNSISPLGDGVHYGTPAPSDALAPGLMLGSLIVKVGPNGTPFQPFSRENNTTLLDGYTVNSNEEIFIAINDANFSDNRGEHAIIVQGQALNMGQSASSDQNAPASQVSNPAGDTSAPAWRSEVDKLQTYCKARYGHNTVAMFQPGASWRCLMRDPDTPRKYMPLDLDEVCRINYGNNYKAVIDDPKDFKGWRCTTK